MSTKAQKKATATHRRRTVAQGLVRVEVQAPKGDTGLIRAVAERLRGNAAKAKSLRSVLEMALSGSDPSSAFDVFGSELPDSAFSGVFNQKRDKKWREAEI
jgi:hypothetical protein